MTKSYQDILADHDFRHVTLTGSYMDAFRAFCKLRFPNIAPNDLTDAQTMEAINAVDLVRHENEIRRTAMEKEMI
jgi:hypothetical protein